MDQEMAYTAWRFDMWLKGYGSYEEIERRVATGALVLGKKYPTAKNQAITANEHLQRAGDIADEALKQYHRLGYADRLNALWEALLQVSNERIEYNNTIGGMV